MITEFITKLENNTNLSYEEMSKTMNEILGGRILDEETTSFLKNLTVKGETDDELLAMLDIMQKFATNITPKCKTTLIDVCGTGGDNMMTFNVSTAAAFVIAASGGAVAKHGNRAVSSVCGSADIFEHFGYDLNASPERITQIIEKFGIGFMFAQKFHPAMKNVAKARKMIGTRTAFNLLGPLCNPANVKNQLIGVFSEDFLERIPNLLKKKNSETIMAVRSKDGLDELSTTSKNQIYLLKNKKIETFVLDPQEFGLEKSEIKQLQVTSKENAIDAFVSVLNCSANKAMIETTALNAAGGLIVANIADNFASAIDVALDTLQSEKAYKLFREFIFFCGNKNVLKELETS
ncbi:MAG: anthranilate phosphoribosyltransferase [Nitrosopumilaceae archaeon]